MKDYFLVGSLGPGLWRARHLPTDQMRWLFEVAVADGLTEPMLRTLERRARGYTEVLVALAHPGLAKVYEFLSEEGRQFFAVEEIEGTSLEALLGLRVGPLPEREARAWLLQLADLLHYLHERPRPLRCGQLAADQLRVTPAGRLVLVDYQLGRLFAGGQELFGADLARDLAGFGRLGARLLSGLDPPPVQLPGRRPTAAVVNRCLWGDRSMLDFARVAEELRAIDLPPEPAPPQPWPVLPDLRPALRWLAAAAALSVLALGMRGLIRKPPQRLPVRSGPTLYLARGDSVALLRPGDRRPYGRFYTATPVLAVAGSADGRTLLVSRAGARLEVRDGTSHRLLRTVPLAGDCDRLVGCARLAVACQGGLVNFASTDELGPQLRWNAGSLEGLAAQDDSLLVTRAGQLGRLSGSPLIPRLWVDAPGAGALALQGTTVALAETAGVSLRELPSLAVKSWVPLAPVQALTFSPAGLYVASDRTLRLVPGPAWRLAEPARQLENAGSHGLFLLGHHLSWLPPGQAQVEELPGGPVAAVGRLD